MTNLIPERAFWETNLGVRVEKSLAVETDANIFTTYGRNYITLLCGQVTTALGGAGTIKLRKETGTRDLCAATTIDDDPIGTRYFLTGEVAVILNGTGNAPVIDLAAGITGFPTQPIILGRKLTADAIEQVETGNDSAGVILWTVFYVPLDNGSYIVAA